MYSKQPKKMIMYNILDILKKYTDENHRLSQKEIQYILEKEYQMKADRKSIKANLMNLEDLGYQLEYSETVRSSKNKTTGEQEENVKYSDFYLVHDFEDAELRLIIDSLLFSRNLPYNHRKQLIDKLVGLSNQYFKSRVKHIATIKDNNTYNQQLFYNIEILDEAIERGKKVRFKYLEYTTELEMVPKKDNNGKVREYVVSPYQMAAKDGKYYLICNYDFYNDISNYRVDRISDISIIDEKIKSFQTLKGANGKSLNISDYIQEHIYMYSGETVCVELSINIAMISDLIDMFGKDIRFYEQDAQRVKVKMKVNENAIIQFAKNYAPDVIVLGPESIREKVIEELKKGIEGYGN